MIKSMIKRLRLTQTTRKRLSSLLLMLKKRMRKRKVNRKKKMVLGNRIAPLIKRHLQVLKKKEMMILGAASLQEVTLKLRRISRRSSRLWINRLTIISKVRILRNRLRRRLPRRTSLQRVPHQQERTGVQIYLRAWFSNSSSDRQKRARSSTLTYLPPPTRDHLVSKAA